ncbi:mycofactocin oligosaccharide methyltransferase MftM [Pseudonocardia bannensis]|uniref:Class I SAM-dependent methyltransferase n=1 Tax=Pseudonocardia bannensis TaxID=630973 RepID=A0A848DR35_9PSEU|nr:mycofactocin oligosaccharide methyltransferase MftM [Pseudonocardia bannensis]NMH94896.1 class I SAM-dependent methyltransferase [Pseudonocardia bannensis]
MMIDLDRLDNDLAGWLDRTLVRRRLLAPAAFEDAFVAVVTSTAVDPEDAWLAFYRNTMAALCGAAVPGGTNAELKPVHERAAALTVGPDVIELGCCFGFLSLRLAAAGHRVTAVDLSPGTIGLLCRTTPRLGVDAGRLDAVVADARSVPRPSGSADTVLAVHLLEHLDEQAGVEVLEEMLRLARRRVVVAVPYEDEPNPTWGHVRRFDADVLAALGERSGRPYTVTEHHGGWLVIDA